MMHRYLCRVIGHNWVARTFGSFGTVGLRCLRCKEER